ncbi:MAG: hypothetical protein AABZ39_03295 [Spirochaetota bacterium]
MKKTSTKGFITHFIHKSVSTRIKAVEFIPGRSHTEAIAAAIASAELSGSIAEIVLDTQDWIIDRAIRLPSNTDLTIDGCTLKLADGVFDNIIRVAGITPNPNDPNGICRSIQPTENIRIIGRNGAVIEGADHPYSAPNPKTGVVEPWVGDFFGWRTVGILLSGAHNYDISGFTMQKTHCWAISQDSCTHGALHDIVFNTDVKNGDGIDFRNGCAHCLVENISGTTSDDTIALTALDESVVSGPGSRYIYPMQPMGMKHASDDPDIHDIVVRNIFTGGQHHAVICLATSPSVYDITIENVIEEAPSSRESCVKIYTGYGTGYRKENLRNISVANVVSRGARYAVMVKADVSNVRFENIRQARPDGERTLFEGDNRNSIIMDAAAH